jgi:hypothetical protein
MKSRLFYIAISQSKLLNSSRMVSSKETVGCSKALIGPSKTESKHSRQDSQTHAFVCLFMIYLTMLSVPHTTIESNDRKVK